VKKYILGLLVGVVFLAYSTVLRHQHSASIIAPATLSKKNSSSSSSSTSTSSNASPSTNSSPATVQYKDGTYQGSVANAFYGNVQVSATITSGKITSVDFLQSPNENPNSIYVNQQADPFLKQEAIQAQSANVSIVTGATFTSQAFVQSLTSALNQAKQG